MDVRRHYAARRATAGFTLFELAVVIVLIGILAAVLLNRVLYYRELAEQVEMEHTVAVMRSSLRLQVASLIAKGRTDQLRHFAEQNPIAWLAEKPANYRGEFDYLDEQSVVSGSWIFDKKTRNLVYLVHNAKNFQGGNVVGRQVLFRVSLVFGENRFPEEKEAAVEGVILKQVSAYRWLKQVP